MKRLLIWWKRRKLAEKLAVLRASKHSLIDLVLIEAECRALATDIRRLRNG